MENARVAIFEDREEIRGLFIRFLEANGHSIVGQASTMQIAESLIDELPIDSLDVALVDGDLTGRDLTDGTKIVELLSQKFGDTVFTIGISGSGDIENANANYRKGSTDTFKNVVERIASL